MQVNAGHRNYTQALTKQSHKRMQVCPHLRLHLAIVIATPPGVGGGTRIGFGWACAAQASNCRPRFRKGLQSK